MAIQQFTVRSISLPSRLNPNGLKIDAELDNLRQWESSSSSIEAGLVDLAELYNSAREALESSTTQAALLHHQNGILVEKSLEGSIELLDSCGAIKDLFSTMKQNLQELQSALRRKNGGSTLACDINTFTCCRKRVKKESAKILRKLKHMEGKFTPCSSLDMDHNLAAVVKMLGEVTAITVSVLRSLLVFLSNSSGSASTSSRWSLISKMITAKSHKGNALNDLGFADLALASLHGIIKNGGESKNEAQMVKGQLQILDGRIEGLESGLECLFRQLVRHRVTLLNMITL